MITLVMNVLITVMLFLIISNALVIVLCHPKLQKVLFVPKFVSLWERMISIDVALSSVSLVLGMVFTNINLLVLVLLYNSTYIAAHIKLKKSKILP